MTSHNAREPVEAIPADIMDMAWEAMSDPAAGAVMTIAKVILAERERCASIASHFMGSLWSSDQNHAASLIFNEIAHPAPKTEG